MTPSLQFRFNRWFAFGLLLSLAAIALFSGVSFASSASPNLLPDQAGTQQTAVLLAPSVPNPRPDLPWVSGYTLPGTNGIVHTAVIGSNGNLYIGGQFSVVGDVEVSNIARWDGSNWHALDNGINGIVYALALDSTGTLYAGGDFTSAGNCTTDCNRIAAWDGTAWSALSTGIDGPGGTTVRTLLVNSDDHLYAGGDFAKAGSCTNPCANIARWNGTTWNPLNTGVPGTVQALAVDSTDNLYVGGEFFGIDGCPGCLAIGRWNGTSWNELDNGVSGFGVYALAIDADDNVYVGGDFFAAGPSCFTCFALAKWNGTTWSDIGYEGSGIPVTELTFNSSDKLYVYAEEFPDHGYITTWSNATWGNLVTDFPIDVNALVINNSGKVYIGGGFDTVGECWSGCFSVAQLNGSTWSPLGQHGRGPDGFPSSLAVAPDGDLYLGGAFSRVGACIDCFSIVHGDGSNWQALSNGPMHAVTAIAFDSAGNLYAGGFGGVSKWDGASWALLGADIFAPIYSMVFDANDTLYIGGNFIVSDCIECYNIAKWGGTAWEPLDIGIFDPVRTLAVGSDNTLYVGGDFTFIPGSVADCGQCTYIASWNGAWAPLASTPNGPVRTLALDSNDTLYAGGSFNTAGSCFSNCLNIAMWNGSDWNSLGSGTNNRVDTLAVDSDDTLYAGGGFTSAGTCIGCNNIARWDGTTWHDLDNGTDGWVTALAIGHTGRVYAAGQFSHAGDKISRNFAAQSVKVYLPFMVR